MIKNILKFVFFVGLCVLFIWLAFRGFPFSRLIEGLKKANYFWVIFSVALAFIAFLSRAYRWRLLIEPLGHKPAFSRCYHALMFGYMANFALPRMGEVSKCGALTRTDDIPFKKLIGTVIIERVCDLLMLFFLLVVLFVFKFAEFGVFIKENIFEKYLDKINMIIQVPLWIWILSAVLFISVLLVLYKIRYKFSHTIVYVRVVNFIKGIKEGLFTVYHMKRKWEFVFHSLFIWVCYYFMTYVSFFCYKETSHLGLVDAIFVLAIGSLAMSAPVQGGIGVYHILIASALTLYGLDYETGLVFATLQHEAQSFLAIMLGLLSLVYIFYIIKPKNKTFNIWKTSSMPEKK